LTSDTLTAHAERTDDGDQRLTGIDAAGQVRMTAQRAADDQPVSIAGDTMRVDVTTDEAGKQQPTRLRADGRVAVQQPGLTLTTAALDASLGPVTEHEGDEPTISVT